MVLLLAYLSGGAMAILLVVVTVMVLLVGGPVRVPIFGAGLWFCSRLWFCLGQSFSDNYAYFIPFLRHFATNYLKQRQDFLDERQNLLEDSEDGNQALDKYVMDSVLEARRRGETTKDNILYMMENLNIAKNIREEMDQVLGAGSVVQERDICKLPYLQNAVKEYLPTKGMARSMLMKTIAFLIMLNMIFIACVSARHNVNANNNRAQDNKPFPSLEPLASLDDTIPDPRRPPPPRFMENQLLKENLTVEGHMPELASHNP